MNILITGVHGFVGSNFVKALAPENTIYGLDIVAPEKEGIVRLFYGTIWVILISHRLMLLFILRVRPMILATRVRRMCISK